MALFHWLSSDSVDLEDGVSALGNVCLAQSERPAPPQETSGWYRRGLLGACLVVPGVRTPVELKDSGLECVFPFPKNSRISYKICCLFFFKRTNAKGPTKMPRGCALCYTLFPCTVEMTWELPPVHVGVPNGHQGHCIFSWKMLFSFHSCLLISSLLFTCITSYYLSFY